MTLARDWLSGHSQARAGTPGVACVVTTAYSGTRRAGTLSFLRDGRFGRFYECLVLRVSHNSIPIGRLSSPLQRELNVGMSVYTSLPVIAKNIDPFGTTLTCQRI